MRILLFSICITIIFSACDSSQKQNDFTTNNSIIPIEIITEIGKTDQPFEYQLGQPVAVRTDNEGNIYIADRASLTVKVFDKQGTYLRSFGGRGRGPGEFMLINLMEIADSDGNLLFLDRGKLEFIFMNTEGDFISSYPIDLSNQYYPKSVKIIENNTIGLQQNGEPRSNYPHPINRPLFYVYDTTLQQFNRSFLEFYELGYNAEEMFIWSSFLFYPGNFDIRNYQNKIIYSPGVYTGKLYEFAYTELDNWKLKRTITATPPLNLPYEIYKTEAEYERMSGIPGVNQIFFSGQPDWGRLYSVDAGIYYLDDERIVQFYGEWRGGDISLEEGNTLDLFVQIIEPEGEVAHHGFIKSLYMDSRPSLVLVNWKDADDNFYLLNLPNDDVPTVIKFRLDL